MIEMATVDRVSGGLAYIRTKGDTAARLKPAQIPKNSGVAAGDRVAVTKTSGGYIILAAY